MVTPSAELVGGSQGGRLWQLFIRNADLPANPQSLPAFPPARAGQGATRGAGRAPGLALTAAQFSRCSVNAERPTPFMHSVFQVFETALSVGGHCLHLSVARGVYLP